MIFFGDEHGLQCVEGALLFFVGDEDAALLAVEGPIDAGHGAELWEDVPDVALRQTLVVDERDGVVAEFISLKRGKKYVLRETQIGYYKVI